MRSSAKHLWSDQSGAIAAVYALALPALIAAGGIAFDYARMASLDTELQNAADHAALAAASQLDGQLNACSRAVDAAKSLTINQARFANDGGGLNITVADAAQTGCGAAASKIKFYSVYTEATKTRTYTDADAKFVSVTVNSRKAVYALTPIVALSDSGDLAGTAVAGLASSICKVPPVMMCNPNEGSDPNFTIANYTGKGMLLVARQNTADAYGPGNFGFLDTGYDQSNGNGGGTAALRRALGQQSFVADCLAATGVTTEPGASSPALDAVNTRFDIYSQNVMQNTTCGNGQCPPSTNVRKDLVWDSPGNGPNKKCNLASENGNAKGWRLANSGLYLPTSATADFTGALSPMGHPRDKCHAFNPASGCSGGRIGDGAWDRAAYFRSNFGSSYNWQAAMTAEYGKTNVSRYEIYKWELKPSIASLNPGGISQVTTVAPGESRGAPICQTPGSAPTGNLDRRKLSVAVVNCANQAISGGINGKKTNVAVVRWVDVFLVEPSANRTRTTANDLYVELIGETTIVGVGGQTSEVKKSVPYLLE